MGSIGLKMGSIRVRWCKNVGCDKLACPGNDDRYSSCEVRAEAPTTAASVRARHRRKRTKLKDRRVIYSMVYMCLVFVKYLAA